MRAGAGRAALLMTLALATACRSRATEASSDAGHASGPEPRLTLARCDTLLPADQRELMLPGFTLREERACPTCAPLCILRSATDKEVSVSVTWDCKPHYAEADLHALLAPTLRAGGEEIPALGRAAARRAPVQGMLQVMTWDDDTPCALIVTWLGGTPEQAVDVARMAVGATRPDSFVSAPPPDAGAP